MARISQLKVVSLGTVAADKALDSDKIEVTLNEYFPMLNGELTTQVVNYESKAADSDGVPYENSIPTSATVSAQWLPLGAANRLTPPDVTKGEEVVIYTFGDGQEKFYWVTRNNDMRFRKSETVVFGISATEDYNPAPSSDNMYLITLSSHERRIRITTSKQLEEPFAYDIDINTGQGYIKFTDDIGNMFLLNSVNNQLRMENCDGSYYDITGNAITQEAADSIASKTKAYSVECETFDIKAGESASLETTTNSIKAETTHEGNTLHKGNLTLVGNLKGTKGGAGGGGGGTAEFDGSLEVAEGIMTPATMHAGQVISDQDVIAPNVG